MLALLPPEAMLRADRRRSTASPSEGGSVAPALQGSADSSLGNFQQPRRITSPDLLLVRP